MASKFELLIINEALSDEQKGLVDDFDHEAKKFKAARIERKDHYTGEEPEHLGHEQHDDLFYKHTGNASSERLISPLGSDRTHINPHPLVKLWLESNGYSTDKYHDKIATKKELDGRGQLRERSFRIGAILQKNAPSGVRKAFETDPAIASSKNEIQMVVSRNKYDIGGMTSGRHWVGQSCMRLPGEEISYPEKLKAAAEERGYDLKSYENKGGEHYGSIEHDFKHGTLVGYFTKKGDDEVNSPISRVLFKKMIGTDKESGEKHTIFRPEAYHYGENSPAFEHHAEKFAKENWPAKAGFDYRLQRTLYNDGLSEFSHREDGWHKNYDGSEDFHIKDNTLHSPDNDTPAERRKSFDGESHAFYKNGKLHRDGDLPAIIKNSKDKNDVDEQYYKNGLIHRDGDKPASIKSNGEFGIFTYQKYGILHRDGDKPAFLEKTKGKQDTEMYYKFGLYHRDGDKPAIIAPGYQHWYMHGQPHRDGDKPAIIEEKRTYDGLIKKKVEWRKEGNAERADGKPYRITTTHSPSEDYREVEKNYNVDEKNNHLSMTNEGHTKDHTSITHYYEKPDKLHSSYSFYNLRGDEPMQSERFSEDHVNGNSKHEIETLSNEKKTVVRIKHYSNDAESRFSTDNNTNFEDHSYDIDTESGKVIHKTRAWKGTSSIPPFPTETTHNLSSLPNDHKERIRGILNLGSDHMGFIDGLKKKLLGEEK